MRVLLPPSETKRDGGRGKPIDLARLSFPSLTHLRDRLVTATIELAADPQACMRALKLGPTLAFEVERNAALLTNPTMPAVDRYTGVLFDALDAGTLTDRPRRELLRHALIQSALWGPISAADSIPAYRLSCTTRLPSMAQSLTALWTEATAGLTRLWTGFTLDMRSEGYSALTPAPPGRPVDYLRVATRDSEGRVAALNHFNKKSKGLFLRSLAETGGLAGISSREDLVTWARENAWVLEQTGQAELTLLVE